MDDGRDRVPPRANAKHGASSRRAVDRDTPGVGGGGHPGPCPPAAPAVVPPVVGSLGAEEQWRARVRVETVEQDITWEPRYVGDVLFGKARIVFCGKHASTLCPRRSSDVLDG